MNSQDGKRDKRNSMAEIVLATLNARYQHASFGLRYLQANLGELQSESILLEFDLQQRPIDVADAILKFKPRIVGLGVYIWNLTLSTELVVLLKTLDPRITLILGGPEVSYDAQDLPIVAAADYVISGEGDLEFPWLCREILAGHPPSQKFRMPELPSLDQFALPYELYSDEDIAHRLIYVEASRGCPFRCEFCLSSLDIPVRRFPLPALLESFRELLNRGVRHFKFVDRTFNLDLKVSLAILRFFHENLRPNLFLHFEMIPDRLPPEIRDALARFPPGTIQLEIGIQTFNEEVCARIQRRQNSATVEENIGYLRNQTGIHLHTDLIVGLPGESLASIADGFDRLIRLDPHEIQVGILKRLRGTPLPRHDAEWEMIYSPLPPYELLRSKNLGFDLMQRLKRFARYWDLVGNSGNFLETRKLLWENLDSPFAGFLTWSDWLFERINAQHGIALSRLTRLLFEYLISERTLPPDIVHDALNRDYRRAGRGDPPLPKHDPPSPTSKHGSRSHQPSRSKRQTRFRNESE